MTKEIGKPKKEGRLPVVPYGEEWRRQYNESHPDYRDIEIW
jgi:hypothetical protein